MCVLGLQNRNRLVAVTIPITIACAGGLHNVGPHLNAEAPTVLAEFPEVCGAVPMALAGGLNEYLDPPAVPPNCSCASFTCMMKQLDVSNTVQYERCRARAVVCRPSRRQTRLHVLGTPDCSANESSAHCPAAASCYLQACS